MSSSQFELPRLIDAADAAYQRARVLVIDRLGAGEFPDERMLNYAQREAMRELRRAEQAITDYREREYGRVIRLPDQADQVSR